MMGSDQKRPPNTHVRSVDLCRPGSHSGQVLVKSLMQTLRRQIHPQSAKFYGIIKDFSPQKLKNGVVPGIVCTALLLLCAQRCAQ